MRPFTRLTFLFPLVAALSGPASCVSSPTDDTSPGGEGPDGGDDGKVTGGKTQVGSGGAKASGGGKATGGDDNLGGVPSAGGESSGGSLASGGSGGSLGGQGGEGPGKSCDSALDCTSDNDVRAASCHLGECGPCQAGVDTLAVKVSSAPMPIVYVLADASSSMFEGDSLWSLLGTGVLPALEARDSSLKLGFGLIQGASPSDCTGLENLVSPGEMRGAQIRAAYESVTPPSGLTQSPLPQAILEATELLAPYAAQTNVSLLIFSDGDGDFCDNGDPTCPFDATVFALQAAAAQGIISTLVSPGSQLVNVDLDVLAQAGAGEKPSWSKGLEVDTYLGTVEGQCRSSAEWKVFQERAGHAPPGSCTSDPAHAECHLPAGNYSEAGGVREAIVSTDSAVLNAALETELDALTECSLSLAQPLSLTSTLEAELLLGGEALDAPSWTFRNPGLITLSPSACAEYQQSLNGELLFTTLCGLVTP